MRAVFFFCVFCVGSVFVGACAGAPVGDDAVAAVDTRGAVAVDVPGCPPVAEVRRGATVFSSGGLPGLRCTDDAVTLTLAAGERAVVDDRGDVVVIVVDDACAGICGGAAITHAHRQECAAAQRPTAPLRLRRPPRLVVVTPPACDPRLP